MPRSPAENGDSLTDRTCKVPEHPPEPARQRGPCVYEFRPSFFLLRFISLRVLLNFSSTAIFTLATR
jgi:hypothetical protein